MLSGVFVAALLVTVFFALKFALHLGHFRERVAHDLPLEPWMRNRYVAMSYDVPPQVVDEILGTGLSGAPHSGRPPTMGEVAAEQGVTLDALTERLRAGVAEYRVGTPQ